jgi:polyisoprenoid-binding protein YceI
MTAQDKIVNWYIDTNHSTFEFEVRQAVVSTIKGAFGGVTGDIVFDPDAPENSHVNAVVDISTLNTNHAGRDQKILSAEGFFEVERFPTAEFNSNAVRHVTGDTYAVDGDLTMRGVTKPVTFSAEFQGTHPQADGVLRGAFIAVATIKRSDYGFTLGLELPGGGRTHSDDVKLAMFTTIKPKVDD